MSRLNIKKESIYTHEGAKASHINSEQQLRRSVMACLLWEDQFYEDGESIADRISNAIPKVEPEKVAQIAIEARNKMKLRHMPLFITSEMVKHPGHKKYVSSILSEIIQRPDELSELLAIYWKQGKCPIASQIKKGLAKAFTKFDEYQLAKYNRDNAIKLRDVLFLCHAKPKNKEQEALWKRLVDGNLQTPDTWEVSLSAKDDKDKKSKWERLLKENKLGAMALLRNLRNFEDESVDRDLIKTALMEINTSKVLPFRFITAAKYAPKFEPEIEIGLLKCLQQIPKLEGKTILIVDVSGSMYGSNISAKSELNRANVACSLAIIIRGLCEDSAIYATAGNDATRIHQTQIVPSRQGFALSDAIYNLCCPLGGGGIFLVQVMDYVFNKEKSADRIIVITDEQDCDINKNPESANAFGKQNYLINVASAKNGIGYHKWVHIDGWSEAIINYIRTFELAQNKG